MKTCVAPVIRNNTSTPRITSRASCCINASSHIIPGSHSAALIIKVWQLVAFFNFECVGNPAPPKPTMPDCCRYSIKVSREQCKKSPTPLFLIHSSLPSDSMVIQFDLSPDLCGIICASIATTVPEIEA